MLRSAVLGGIALALLAGPGTVSSSAGPLGSSASADAAVRGAHFSPDTPGVDVYLTAVAGGSTQLWLSGVGYGDVSPYRRLAPGLYAVSMRAHGASASTPAALSWTLNAQAGQAYTAAAVGMNKDLHGIILVDEPTAPSAGHGRVRVIQAASRAPRASVVAQNGVVVAGSVAFATYTPYTSVAAGIWPVQARSLSTTSVVADTSLHVASGSVSSIVLLDSEGSGITIRTVTDAAGAAITPAGPAPAGGGGTAPRPDDGWIGGTLLGVLAMAGAGVIALRRVRARVPH